MIATKPFVRTLWVLTAALCMTASLMAVGAGRAEATEYCYGDDSMCWNVSDQVVTFSAEVDIRRGPVPGIYYDSAWIYVRWVADSQAINQNLRVTTAHVELSVNETTDRRAYFSHQIMAWPGNNTVSSDFGSNTPNDPGDRRYGTDRTYTSELGDPFRQFAEMDIFINLATPGSNTWHFRVRTPVLESAAGEPFKWNPMEPWDLPSDPIDYGWTF